MVLWLKTWTKSKRRARRSSTEVKSVALHFTFLSLLLINTHLASIALAVAKDSNGKGKYLPSPLTCAQQDPITYIALEYPASTSRKRVV
jgi:hypothetical protein